MPVGMFICSFISGGMFIVFLILVVDHCC